MLGVVPGFRWSARMLLRLVVWKAMLAPIIVEDHRIQSAASPFVNGKGASEEQGDEFLPSTSSEMVW